MVKYRAWLVNNYFKISIRRISATPSEKEGVFYIEEVYSLRIKRQDKTIVWIVILEIYEYFKVIIVSFYLKKHQHNSGIRQFHRNKKEHCIDPFFTLCLFRNCLEICQNARNEGFSIGFYALDDVLLTEKEDMNKRMSSYTSFLSRIAEKKLPGFKQAGNITQNLLIVYNPEITTLKDVEKFITVYIPIIEKDLEALYNKKESHKL